MSPTNSELQHVVAKVLKELGPSRESAVIQYASAYITTQTEFSFTSEDGSPESDIDGRIRAELGYMYDRGLVERDTTSYDVDWYRLTEKGRIKSFGTPKDKIMEIWNAHWIAILGVGVAIIGNMVTLIALLIQSSK